MTQQEKAFVFHTKEDYIVYLHELIAVVFEHMFCLSGVRNCIKSVLKTTNGNIINADIYNALPALSVPASAGLWYLRKEAQVLCRGKRVWPFRTR